jgi:hypothetical protein
LWVPLQNCLARSTIILTECVYPIQPNLRCLTSFQEVYIVTKYLQPISCRISTLHQVCCHLRVSCQWS